MKNMQHVTVDLDNILVTGPSEEEHLKNLDEVLSRLKQTGRRLKRSKCTDMQLIAENCTGNPRSAHTEIGECNEGLLGPTELSEL